MLSVSCDDSPLSQRQISLNLLFSRIDFAETLQRGSFDQNSQMNQVSFFQIRPTSGFLGNFRFRLVCQISRYIDEQSKLGIAQIEA